MGEPGARLIGELQVARTSDTNHLELGQTSQVRHLVPHVTALTLHSSCKFEGSPDHLHF